MEYASENLHSIAKTLNLDFGKFSIVTSMFGLKVNFSFIWYLVSNFILWERLLVLLQNPHAAAILGI